LFIYSIYTFTNSITGKKYVGYTSNVQSRLKGHRYSFKKGVKSKLYGAMKKYGYDNFIFDVVYQSKEKEHTLNVMENYFIHEYDSFNHGYNLTLGGDGGNTVFDKKLHSERTKKGQSRPEVREKIVKHLQQHVKTIQPLAAKAAKEKLTGVPKTEEHKQKMRGKRPNVNQKGSNNNSAKTISTPFGIFGSIREASIKLEGYTYKMIWDRLHNDKNWRYI
jgi:group I intron endonuclease